VSEFFDKFDASGRKTRAFVRFAMTVSLPVVLVWAFCSKLCAGIVSAFGDARREVRLNIADYARLMEEERRA
jgi:hypothetical protein